MYEIAGRAYSSNLRSHWADNRAYLDALVIHTRVFRDRLVRIDHVKMYTCLSFPSGESGVPPVRVGTKRDDC